MCRQDGRERFPVLLDDHSKCRTNSQRKSQLSLNSLYGMYIECYIQTVKQITRTLIHKNQFTSLCRGQKPASKCIRLVFEILVICRALQALYTPQRCELMKTKTNNINFSYRIFIVCRSPVSPVFWARIPLTDFCLSRVCAH